MLVPCQLSRPMKRSRRCWQLMRCISNRPSPTETVPRRSPLSIWPPARSRSTGPTRNGIVCWTDPGTQFLATPCWQGTSCQNRPPVWNEMETQRPKPRESSFHGTDPDAGISAKSPELRQEIRGIFIYYQYVMGMAVLADQCEPVSTKMTARENTGRTPGKFLTF